MSSTRILPLLILIVCLGLSCRQVAETAQIAGDSTAVDSTALDSAAIAEYIASHVFNPEDEFLGLGLPMYGDLDSMIARRKIRALVPYTHIYYSINGKQRRGIAFEALNLFEKQINDELKFYPPKVRVLFIPVNRKQIIPLLRDGYADIAYAGMTITEEREKLVDFSIPTITGLKEIIVGGLTSPRLTSLADLSGKELYLHPGSSYESAALKLSDSLERKGLAPIIIKPVDPYLETEDILQLVNAGVMPYSATVEDVARLWTHVMDSLVLYDSIPLARNVSYGMVMRKGSPKLKAAADKFVKKNAKGTAVGNTLYRRYIVSTKLLPNMHDKKTVAQVRALRATFQKYADQYRLDWLLLVAQGYQESNLKQDAISPVGAVGVMQVLPSTAAGRPLYIKNIHVVDNNVHAGVKYMRFLADQYFTGPDIDSLNTQLLALAAYNCGPGRVAQLRKKAKAKGLNPNVWFDNVEIIAAQEIGRETVQYVSNIYKFYTSYRALDYYLAKKEEATKPL
jgi:membrane-bound lytic murein transglycosylase MltF